MEEALENVSAQEKGISSSGSTVVQTEQLLKDLAALDTHAQVRLTSTHAHAHARTHAHTHKHTHAHTYTHTHTHSRPYTCPLLDALNILYIYTVYIYILYMNINICVCYNKSVS